MASSLARPGCDATTQRVGVHKHAFVFSQLDVTLASDGAIEKQPYMGVPGLGLSL
jgi:hypothetical protein